MKITNITFPKLMQLAASCRDVNKIAYQPTELQLVKFASEVIEAYKKMDNFDHIMIETIVDIAKAVGGYVEVDWMTKQGLDMTNAIMKNSSTELFFTRFANQISNELKTQLSSIADQEVQVQLRSQEFPHHMRNVIAGQVAPGAVINQTYVG